VSKLRDLFPDFIKDDFDSKYAVYIMCKNLMKARRTLLEVIGKYPDAHIVSVDGLENGVIVMRYEVEIMCKTEQEMDRIGRELTVRHYPCYVLNLG
jgi:hypothetical protein